jgi:hypothetical protein
MFPRVCGEIASGVKRSRMALPPEHRTPRVEALEAIVARTPRERLVDFPVLQPSDHQMIGTFIQLFNYIDFSLRRAIETFAHAKLLQTEAAKAYPKIHSSKVASTVQDAVKAMDAKVENIADTINVLTIIERRREIRNLLGHWAARRIPDEDAIVLMTKNEADALQTGGAYLATGVVKSATLDLADLRRLIDQIASIELWLAQKTSEWRKRYIGD